VTAAAWPQGPQRAWSDLDWPRKQRRHRSACRHCCAPARGWAGACGQTAAADPAGRAEATGPSRAGENDCGTTRQQEPWRQAVRPRWPRSAAATGPCRGLLKHRFVLRGAVRAREKPATVVADAGPRFSASGPAAAFTYSCPKQEKAGGARTAQTARSDSRFRLFARGVGGASWLASLHHPASLAGEPGERLRPPSPAPLALGSWLVVG